MDQENVMSDWKLNRMKKSDIIAVLRETEEKLAGFTASANKAVVEIEELNERIDDHMIQEAMNVKTINELNESNKRLMEKVKFYQVQKENNKNKENKVADYLNNGLIEKIELLEKEKEELIEECKEKNVKNEQLEEEVQKWKEQVEENYKHHYDQFEPVLLENEKLKEENKRLTFKMELRDKQISKQLDVFHEVKSAIDNLKITQDETLGDIW